MPTITLNDDTRYEVEWCFADARALMCEIVGDYTVLELAEVFSHTTSTERITFTTTNAETIYEDYTRLCAVMLDPVRPELAQITLTKTEE